METFSIITWPEIQELMHYPWFDEECELINSDKGQEKYGSSAYFVPDHRLKEVESDQITCVEDITSHK